MNTAIGGYVAIALISILISIAGITLIFRVFKALTGKERLFLLASNMKNPYFIYNYYRKPTKRKRIMRFNWMGDYIIPLEQSIKFYSRHSKATCRVLRRMFKPPNTA